MADDVAAPLPQLDEFDTDALFAGAKAGAAGTAAPASSVRRLTVGRADDPSERLADRMADSAVSQLRRSEHGPSPVRRSSSNPKDPLGGSQVDDDIQRTIDSRRGSGSGLRKRESEHFSNSYGTDLSSVRVHTDSTADKLSRSLQADAFTTGNDIFFRKGTYQPGTSSGDRLIGHELAHVASEGGGARRSIMRAVRNELMSTKQYQEMVPSIAGYVWGKDPGQREALEKMVADYYKLVPTSNGITPLMDNKLDQAESLLQGMISVAKSYLDDAGLKKDAKQAEGFKKFLKQVEGVEEAVQKRRLDNNRQPDVKPNEAAQKFKKHDPADNVTLFTKVGMLVGSQLEDDGDSVETSVELSIPIPPYTLGASLGLEAERDDGMYKIKGNIAIKGGGKIPKVAEITASLGGYLEAQAADPKLAGDLLGYALYRRMAESSLIPAEAQYYLFGTAGRDGKESSEANMAYIEQMAFGDGADEGNYAESGGIVEVEAKGKVPLTDAKATATAGGSMGSRTDKKSLEMNKMQAGGAKGKQSGLVSAVTLGARGAEKTTGRTTKGFNLKVEFTKPLKVEGEYQLHWIQEGEDISELDTHELGITLTLPKKLAKNFGEAKEKVEPVMKLISAYLEGKAEAAEVKSKKAKAEIFATSTMPKMLETAGDVVLDKTKEMATDALMDNDNVKNNVKALGEMVGYKDQDSVAVALTIDFTSGDVAVSLIETNTKKLEVLGLEAEMKKSSKSSKTVRKGKSDEEGAAS